MLTAACMPVCQEAIARHFLSGIATCQPGDQRLDRGPTKEEYLIMLMSAGLCRHSVHEGKELDMHCERVSMHKKALRIQSSKIV